MEFSTKSFQLDYNPTPFNLLPHIILPATLLLCGKVGKFSTSSMLISLTLGIIGGYNEYLVQQDPDNVDYSLSLASTVALNSYTPIVATLASKSVIYPILKNSLYVHTAAGLIIVALGGACYFLAKNYEHKYATPLIAATTLATIVKSAINPLKSIKLNNLIDSAVLPSHNLYYVGVFLVYLAESKIVEYFNFENKYVSYATAGSLVSCQFQPEKALLIMPIGAILGVLVGHLEDDILNYILPLEHFHKGYHGLVSFTDEKLLNKLAQKNILISLLFKFKLGFLDLSFREFFVDITVNNSNKLIFNLFLIIITKSIFNNINDLFETFLTTSGVYQLKESFYKKYINEKGLKAINDSKYSIASYEEYINHIAYETIALTSKFGTIIPKANKLFELNIDLLVFLSGMAIYGAINYIVGWLYSISSQELKAKNLERDRLIVEQTKILQNNHMSDDNIQDILSQMNEINTKKFQHSVFSSIANKIASSLQVFADNAFQLYSIYFIMTKNPDSKTILTKEIISLVVENIINLLFFGPKNFGFLKKIETAASTLLDLDKILQSHHEKTCACTPAEVTSLPITHNEPAHSLLDLMGICYIEDYPNLLKHN